MPKRNTRRAFNQPKKPKNHAPKSQSVPQLNTAATVRVRKTLATRLFVKITKT